MRFQHVVLVVSLFACLIGAGPLEQLPAQTTTALTESLRSDVEFLSSDELQGRSVTDASIDRARDYLRDRMAQIGLELDFANGTPFQTVPIEVGSEIASAEKNFARFTTASGRTIETTVGDGFGPLAVGARQGQASAPLVFAGYGITSADHSYDDYQAISAVGKIVVLLRKEPGPTDPDSPFSGAENTTHALFHTKIANAIGHGAVAVLIVNDADSVRAELNEAQERIRGEQARKTRLAEVLASIADPNDLQRKSTARKIAEVEQIIQSSTINLDTLRRGVLGVADAGTPSSRTDKIPVASIARDVADQLLTTAGAPGLEAIESKINTSYQPSSYDLGSARAHLSVDLKASVVESENVIGRIPGKGSLAAETIVIGAHYDHVGMGGFGSLAPGTVAVHNGADDNASGTAAMLACARVLAERLRALPSHRAVLLIAFTGEERGLIGSKYYVRHPLAPLGSTAAMINLDMVGRIRDNELSVYGTGSASGMDAIVEAANREHGFTLFKVASGYGPSDHDSFYRARVPVLFFFTGIHNDYHRPSDDFDKIDFGNLTRVTDMVSSVAYQLAVRPQRPTYSVTQPRVQIRRQLTAYLGVRVSQQSGQVRITEVTEGGPASEAGLQVGDQIRRIGTNAIRTTNDVLSWVRQHAPGDKFEVQVRRNASLITLRGKLGKRSD